MRAEDYLPYVLTIVFAVGGAYIAVKVAIAELKKDMGHLGEKLEAEIASKNKMESDHTATMNEVRGDLKAVFKVLTTIQVNQAKSEGRDDVLNVVKDAVVAIAQNKTKYKTG